MFNKVMMHFIAVPNTVHSAVIVIMAIVGPTVLLIIVISRLRRVPDGIVVVRAFMMLLDMVNLRNDILMRTEVTFTMLLVFVAMCGRRLKVLPLTRSIDRHDRPPLVRLLLVVRWAALLVRWAALHIVTLIYISAM